MYGYIYKTTNLVNGKIYIGKKKGKFYAKYLGSGKLLKRAIKKYGVSNFRMKVLEYAETMNKLHTLEIRYIEKYRKTHICYNLSKGGKSGTSGMRASTSTRRKHRYYMLLKYSNKKEYEKMLKHVRKIGKDPEVRRKKSVNSNPWLKGTKGVAKPNSGSFKKGLIPWNKRKHPEYVQGKNHPMYGKEYTEAERYRQGNHNRGKTKETSLSIASQALAITGRKASFKTKNKMSRSGKLAWKRRKEEEKKLCLS